MSATKKNFETENVLSENCSLEESEQALRESEDRFRDLVESTSDWIWQVDKNGIYTYVSPKVKDILGYEPSEVVGKTPFDFMPKAESEKSSKKFGAIAGQKAPFHGLYNWNIRKNGTWVLLETNGVPIIDNKGQLIGYRGIDRDITERKHYEDAIIRAKERLQNILNGVDDGITLTGLDGRVTDCNEASLRLTGLTRNEFIGMNVYDIVVPEDKQRAMDGALKVLEMGKIVNEVGVLREHSLPFCAEITVTVLYENGKPVSFLGVTRDITERKKSEEALRSSEEKFSKAFKHSPNAITITRLTDGMIIEFNDSAVKLFGYNKEDITGKTTRDLGLWANPDDRIRLINSLSSKSSVDNEEFVLRKKDGTYFAVSLFATTMKYQGMDCFLASFIDITERKMAEEALAKNQEELEIIFDSSPMWIFYKDKDNRFLRVNKAFAESMNMSKDEMEGRSSFELFPKKQAEKFWRDDKQVIESGKPITGMIEQQQSKKGLLWVQTDKVPYRDLEGNTIGVICFVQDITEYRKLENELQNYTKNLEGLVEERTKQLQDSERMAAIGQTAGMVGHDLRNPLQSIIGEVYLAEGELKSLPDSDHKESLQESVRVIAEQTSYMDKIVSDLQAFVKPVEVHKETINLKQLIVWVLGQMKNTNLQISMLVDDGIIVNADPQLLKRVLVNLVTNSMQAMPNGGALTLSTKAKGTGEVQIIVEDTGVGIPDSIKPKIFAPLFTTKAKGQGFGLAVCKRVIEAQGGSIFFESQEGKGTKFVVELPSLSTTSKR